jgi:hypothetical protein
MFYMQERHGDHWAPVICRDEPSIGKDGRVKKAFGIGPVVRKVTEVPEPLHGSPIKEIETVLLNDGMI